MRGGDKAALDRRRTALLKYTLCCGLYPQFAAADRFNQFRRSSEAVYHTSSNQQALLHPSSCLDTGAGAGGPAVVREGGGVLAAAPPPAAPPSPCALYCYMKLLETRRPYLTGVFVVEGLQTLLLLARRIDVTETLSALLVDGWLMFEFKDTAVAGKVRPGLCVCVFVCVSVCSCLGKGVCW